MNLKGYTEESGKALDHTPSTLVQLSLDAFRNYVGVTWFPHSGLNVVAGPNAQGKTNLLEAIYFLSTSRLLRSSTERDSIPFELDSCHIRATLGDHGTEIALRLERGSRKRALLNQYPLTTASQLLGRMPTTSLSALDLIIARGEPSHRRLFLDLELSQLYPRYLNSLSQYKKALEQRNALLKRDPPAPMDWFEAWDIALAEHGAALRTFRTDYVALLQEQVNAIHPSLAAQERFSLSIEQKDPSDSPEALKSALSAQLATDRFRGSTTIGPHRDDLRLELNGIDVRSFGSQGQQRTAVISLKLACMKAAEPVLGLTPMLLLDDMLSDLDESRRSQLVRWILANAKQAVLTCTEPEAVGQALIDQAQVVYVRNGQLQETCVS